VETTATLRSWQRRIFLTCWLTYASFYLCRVNLSVALPAIQGEFGWSKVGAGLIGSAFFWVYAWGQFVNGQLGDRLPPRPFVAVGLLASVALNAAFGFAASLPTMVILWGMNGYFQSTGWGPIVCTISHWFGPARRGRLSALLGPSYVLGHVASWLLAGWLVARWGWRAAFWVPAALTVPSVLHWLVRVRNSPEDVWDKLPTCPTDVWDNLPTCPTTVGGNEASDVWDKLPTCPTTVGGNEASDVWDKLPTCPTMVGGNEAPDVWDKLPTCPTMVGGNEAPDVWDKLPTCPTDVWDKLPTCPTMEAPLSGRDGWREVLGRTFTHPRLRWAALTNVAQGFVQGSAVLWVPTYLVEALNMDIGGAAISAVVLPLCGLAGVLVGGWASDRFFRSRVAPMTAMMMAGLAASVLAIGFLAPQGGLVLTMALLGLIGAITYGVGSILVTVLPLSLSHEGGVSSAAGFLDFAGYVGAGIGGLLAGALVDGWGWDAVFICWAVVALLGLATTVPLRRSEV